MVGKDDIESAVKWAFSAIAFIWTAARIWASHKQEIRALRQDVDQLKKESVDQKSFDALSKQVMQQKLEMREYFERIEEAQSTGFERVEESQKQTTTLLIELIRANSQKN